MDVGFPEEELEEASIRWEIVRVGPDHRNPLLPVGFPIICEAKTKTICEPALIFLYMNYVKRRAGKSVINTLTAYANDLKDWFVYLEYCGISWLDATKEDIEEYAKIMQSHVSPLTKERYRLTTAKRRTNTVERIYEWCRVAIKPVSEPEKSSLLGMADIGRIVLKNENRESEPVRILTRDQASRLLKAVGPRPNHFLTKNDDFPEQVKHTVYRLALEIGLNLGLRVSEVCNVKLIDIQRALGVALKLTDQASIAEFAAGVYDAQEFKLHVKGKGGKTGQVTVPGHLMKIILAYISAERTMVLAASVNKASAHLLLIPSGRSSGHPLNVRKLQRIFQKGCIDANLKRLLFVEEFHESGKLVEDGKTATEVSGFTFHDLRHTFAVWTYYARKSVGDSEPWLFIQRELRHSFLSTTVEKYLKAAGDFEAYVSDNFMAYLNGKI